MNPIHVHARLLTAVYVFRTTRRALVARRRTHRQASPKSERRFLAGVSGGRSRGRATDRVRRFAWEFVDSRRRTEVRRCTLKRAPQDPALLQMDGLREGAVACRVPYGETNPLLAGWVERDAKAMAPEWGHVCRADDLPVCAPAVAPHQLRKLQWERPLHFRRVSPL